MMDFSVTTPRRYSLANGAVVVVRSLGPDSAPLMTELFGKLSRKTIYHRFLAPISRMPLERIMEYCDLDPQRDCALGAFATGDDSEEFLMGVGRFRCCTEDDEPTAEVAIVVGDPWQRSGIGRMILDSLVVVAKHANLKWFLSTVDPTNRGLLAFAKAVGFKGSTRYESGLLKMRTYIPALCGGIKPDQPQP